MIDRVESKQEQQIKNYHLFQQLETVDQNTTAGLNKQSFPTMYSQQHLQRKPTLVELPNQQQSSNELIGYYFGSISRETAEWILKTHGNQMDGAYLLRSSGPNDDFVLSLMVIQNNTTNNSAQPIVKMNLEVLHYKIVETEDSFVALHGQVGDEKFATIDELIDKAQGVATKPRWPIHRQSLEYQILPPTYWGLTVDQVRLAILIKAKQWGFSLLSSLFQASSQHEQADNFSDGNQQQIIGNDITANTNVTTLNNETIRTLIYKSLHEFQPWFHGKISRDEAEKRVEEGPPRDGKFLVRERDNYSYAVCISHKKTTKHYRVDVLPTGELAIQDGRKFTSLMALVSHYTIMSDGLWCALTEPCQRPIHSEDRNMAGTTLNNAMLASGVPINAIQSIQYNSSLNQNMYCVPPVNNSIHKATPGYIGNNFSTDNRKIPLANRNNSQATTPTDGGTSNKHQSNSLICSYQTGGTSIKAPIKEWLQTINHKWSQLLASKNQHQSSSSFLFGNQNPLNNHCRHSHRSQHHISHRRKCKNGHPSCGCVQQLDANSRLALTLRHPVTNGIGHQPTSAQCLSRPKKTFDCCGGTFCTTITGGANSLMGKNVAVQNGIFNEDQMNLNCISLLSQLPQNSGFTLNSHSFIGSPLFAVKLDQLDRNQRGNQSESSDGSNGNTNNTMEDEKLISPAQSIAGNLNNVVSNTYNVNTDIYGSQASTALINDQVPTSSSSSSCTNMLQRGPKPINQSYPYVLGNGKLINSYKAPFMKGAQAGPILCGQHAGPAYRYTNGNEENFSKPCTHRPFAIFRAADDSQLASTGSQLIGPAAMAKFVQFQDGQCLRTHRDARSIQMAYLMSRQASNIGPNMSRYNQVPFKELNAQQQYDTKFCSNKNKSASMTEQCSRAYGPQPANSIEAKDPGYRQRKHQITGSRHNQMNSDRVLENGRSNMICKDFDLMDCGDEDVPFNFKYDLKLIKSSSIETLCGAGDDEQENLDDLVEHKSNAELMMSLQSCWFPQQHQQNNILYPSTQDDAINSCKLETLDGNENQVGQSSILTSLVGNNNEHEHLNHMRKKHDLDELTTAMLTELTASLKAEADLKNRRAGFGLQGSKELTGDNNAQHGGSNAQEQVPVEVNPIELINEFDTLLTNNNR